MILDTGLSAHGRVLALLIGEHVYGDYGVAFPSIERLATLSGFSKRAVIDALPKIAERGHIEITPPSGKGRGHANEYRLKGEPDALFLPGMPAVEKVQTFPRKGAFDDKRKVQEMHPNKLLESTAEAAAAGKGFLKGTNSSRSAPHRGHLSSEDAAREERIQDCLRRLRRGERNWDHGVSHQESERAFQIYERQMSGGDA